MKYSSISHPTHSINILYIIILFQDDKAVACHVQYLQVKEDDGWAWSSLGDIYLHQGSAHKLTSMASTCFKQALKLTGKITEHVRQWYFIGPFVIGKNEVDGDPVDAYGGIQAIATKRFQKKNKYISELLPNGKITWRFFKQKIKSEIIKMTPDVNWNDLVNSLGSTAITEWQGWVVGEFALNENNQNVIIQCLGVHTVYIDGTPVTGDVYRRNAFWFSVGLSKGIHTIYSRVRAKGMMMFQCTIDIATSSFEILKPSYMPDLYDGHLFGKYIPLQISNYHTSKWLKNIKVTIESQNNGEPLKIIQADDKNFGIAPGQIRPITLQLTSESDIILEQCNDIGFKIKVSTSEGQVVYPLTLRCRNKRESFLFTFLDHDGSVQHSAAIHPQRGCESGLCPVVLSQHGTTVPPQNQADSYKTMTNGNFVFGMETAWLLAPTR